MPNQELINYIEREMKRGVSLDRIKNSLFEAGHRIEHVEEAVKHIRHKKRKGMFFLIGIAAGILATFIIFSAISLNGNMQKSTEKEQQTETLNYDNMTDVEVLNKVMENKNEDLCSYIESQALHQKCVEVTSQKDSRNDRYLFTAAIKTDDKLLCEKIYDKKLMQKCFEQVKGR